MTSIRRQREPVCPHCQESAPWEDNPHRPFCSERCKTIDFGAWANETYTIPVQEEDVSESIPIENH